MKTLPSLFRVAIRVLAVPASSAPVERVSSHGSRGVAQRFSVRCDRHKGLTWEWMGARGLALNLRHASASLPGPPYHIEIRGRTMDYDLRITHQRSQWWIQYGGFYIVRADRSGNGGSCVPLASDGGGGPRPRRRLMMDPNKRQWTMNVDYSGIRSGWRIMILLAADHRF
ncbi:unnamed protein product [Pleuronectes platessa]|uniref:HAT C-terminal dimerisation domain-containing protein n=1 Tax=Pleuronectes platessa TaxID=8262 RepID=A0A9N7VJ68_PLEPL|nr:unnamed protein product [Pleuronectes platessa]